MTDNAYIVENKEQELDVLNKFELKGLVWFNGKMPTNWVPSKHSHSILFEQFPYALVEIENKKIAWIAMGQLTDETIVYDGRNEEKMYKVTQEFMNELIKWRDDQRLGMNTELISSFLDVFHIKNFPDVVDIWWTDPDNTIDNNNRLIAIIKWLNGEDVFEVEEQHKFVVRNDTPDDRGDYWCVKNYKGMTYIAFDISRATKFDTREEAQEWANYHQVVVEIDEEGNEVE